MAHNSGFLGSLVLQFQVGSVNDLNRPAYMSLIEDRTFSGAHVARYFSFKNSQGLFFINWFASYCSLDTNYA